jgi:hypothetical protein
MRGKVAYIKKDMVYFGFFVIFLICISVYYNGVTKYLLKDMRPFIMILSGYVFWGFYRDVFSIRSHDWFESFGFLSFFSGVVNIAILFSGLNSGVEKDVYYEVNIYRYLDAGTYFCCFYILSFFTLYTKKRVEVNKCILIYLIVSVACVLVGNSRFMLLSLLVSISLAYGISLTRIFSVSVLGVVLVSLFWYLSTLLGAERVVESLSLDVLYEQIYSRFLPVLIKFDDAALYNYIFGFMLGDPFFIPWFEYRESLDPFNANVDGLYVTYYAKLGVLFWIPIFYYIKSVVGIGESKMPYLVFMLMIFAVSSTPYQIYAIGLLLGSVFSHLSRSGNFNANK